MTVQAPARRHGRAIGWSAAATVVTGALGWLTMVAVARAEGPRDFAAFAVVWALFFGVGGAFAGLQQEVTRTVTVAARATARLRLLGPAVLLAVPPALVVLALAVANDVEVGGAGRAVGPALAVGVVGLAVLTYVNGVLAARGAWADLALVLSGDAVVRTAAVVACVGAGRTDLLPWAVAAGAFAWLPLLSRPEVRRALGARGADPLGGMVRRAVTAMGSTVCAALLVAGFPLVLALARGHDDVTRSAGVLLATLVLVRSPLLVVLYGFRPAIMASFLATERPLGALVARWWLLLGGLGAAVVVLAAAAGPWLVRVVFGDRYSTRHDDLAALAGGSVLLAMLVVSGLALVAADRHAASTAGWLVALVTSYAVLAVPGSTRVAVLAAVLLAPLAGLGWHALALVGARGGSAPRPATP